MVLIENLIQSCAEGVRSTPLEVVAATHIEFCFACRRRLPIAIGNRVARTIHRVDPDLVTIC